MSQYRHIERTDWAERKKKGAATLTANAIKGINQMPPKGGSVHLSDEEIGSAVAYMLSQLPGDAVTAEAKSAQLAKPPPRGHAIEYGTDSKSNCRCGKAEACR